VYDDVAIYSYCAQTIEIHNIPAMILWIAAIGYDKSYISIHPCMDAGTNFIHQAFGSAQ